MLQLFTKWNINLKKTSYLLFILISLSNMECRKIFKLKRNSFIEKRSIVMTAATRVIPETDYCIILFFDHDCGSCLINLKYITSLMKKEFPELRIYYLTNSPLSDVAQRMIRDLGIDLDNLNHNVASNIFPKGPRWNNYLIITNHAGDVVYYTNRFDKQNFVRTVKRKLRKSVVTHNVEERNPIQE